MSQPDSYRLRLLRAQPHQLVHEVNLMPVEDLLWKPEPSEWSVHECLAHLRDIERQAFLPRIVLVAKEDRPAIRYFDEVAYHKEHYSPGEPLQNMLADFVADRAAIVSILASADWSRVGVHETRGPLTLDWLAGYTANHLWEHLSQILRVRLNYIASQNRT
jgi:hypothetical protein